MPSILWEDQYLLGINEIDTQHKKIIDIINKLHDIAFTARDVNDDIENILKELEDYAIYHFNTEEKYFKMFGYNESKDHIEIHNQYRDRINSWVNEYNRDRDNKIISEMLGFLENWWVFHINNTDRKYAPLFKKMGLN